MENLTVNLPLEIWQNIFHYFDDNSKVNVFKVCKLWKTIFESNYTSKHLLLDNKIIETEQDQTEQCKKFIGPRYNKTYYVKWWKYHCQLKSNWLKMPLENALTVVCDAIKRSIVNYIDGNFIAVCAPFRYYHSRIEIYNSDYTLVDQFWVPTELHEIDRVGDLFILAATSYLWVRNFKNKIFLWKHNYANPKNDDDEDHVKLFHSAVHKNLLAASYSDNKIRIFELDSGIIKFKINSLPNNSESIKLFNDKLYILRNYSKVVTVVDYRNSIKYSVQVIHPYHIYKKIWRLGQYMMINYVHFETQLENVVVWNLNDKKRTCELERHAIRHVNERNSLMICLDEINSTCPIMLFHVINYTNGNHISTITTVNNSEVRISSNNKFIILFSQLTGNGHIINIQLFDILSGNLKRVSWLPPILYDKLKPYPDYDRFEAFETKLILLTYKGCTKRYVRIIFDFDVLF